MPKVKLPRKSTSIDMTAMCDVAFLLLSFFILTAKFKPSDALQVTTPNSVQTKIAPEKDVVMITIDHDGKVFLSISDNNVSQKQDIINDISTSQNLNLSASQKNNFVKQPAAYIGVPFNQLPSWLNHTPDELKNVPVNGIPVDSAHNELQIWIAAAKTAFAGGRMNLLVKGDNAAKYPSFRGVKDAFVRNDEMKFQVVTNPINVPKGTELYKKNMMSNTKAVD